MLRLASHCSGALHTYSRSPRHRGRRRKMHVTLQEEAFIGLVFGQQALKPAKAHNYIFASTFSSYVRNKWHVAAGSCRGPHSPMRKSSGVARQETLDWC